MSDEINDTEQANNYRTVYTELCNSYRAIDEFRTKLLGFLPLATGAGLFLLVTDKDKIDSVQQFLRPIGYFGFIITLGLFFYEIYGIKKCGRLIRVGKYLEEKKLRIDGQFKSRPREVAGLINEPFAAGIIYPAVLAAWIFLALVSTSPRPEPLYDQRGALLGAAVVFIVGVALSILFNVWLKLAGKAAGKKIEEARISEVMAYLKTEFARLAKKVPILNRFLG